MLNFLFLRQCSDMGVSAVREYSDVGTEAVPFKPVMVSRSVGSTVQPQVTIPQVGVSVLLECM